VLCCAVLRCAVCAAAVVAVTVIAHTAAKAEEFALLPRLLNWQQRGLLQLQLHTTRSHDASVALQQQHCDSPTQQQQPPLDVTQGRVQLTHLQQALQQLQGNGPDVDAYVCGPPVMTDEVVSLLQQLGMPNSSIWTEKWW
jgi:NAD(P)H-flavin reductase